MKNFKTKSNLMWKESHSNIVKVCRKFKSGGCTFDERCWYKHTTMENKNETVENSQEMIQRLFSMMENFAAKLELLEKETKK